MIGRRGVLLPIFIAIVTFYFGLGRAEFAGSHEARVAQTARAMAAAGWTWDAKTAQIGRVKWVKEFGRWRLVPDLGAPKIQANPWWVPLLNGQIRLEKPPLPYWCAAVLFKLFGAGEAAARFIPATLGVLATLLLMNLARMLYGRQAAWVAGLLWPTTYVVVQDYRLAIADPYLAFFTLLAVVAWVRASREMKSGLLLVFYLAMGFGVLSKGPVILFTAGLPVVLFHVCFKTRTPRGVSFHFLGIALLLLIAAPWPIDIAWRIPIAPSVWWSELLGRTGLDSAGETRGTFYYLQSLPFLALPWVPLWLLSLVFLLHRRTGRHLFPVLWYGLSVVFFTAMSQKKLPYLLPMMPAQTLMLAVTAAPLIRLARRRTGGLVKAVRFWESIASKPSFVAQAIASAAVIELFSALYLMPANNARSPRSVCRELFPLIDGSHRQLLTALAPPEVGFYLPTELPRGIAPAEYLVVIDDQKGVRARERTHRPERTPEIDQFTPYVTDGKIFEIERVPLQSAPGDARYKVYALKIKREVLAKM